MAVDYHKSLTWHSIWPGSGVNIRDIQELPGHRSMGTAMIHPHVVRHLNAMSISPLDSPPN